MAEIPTKAPIHGYVDSRLRALIEAIAEKENVALSDCVAELLAKAVGRPDLAAVPRKRMGRPFGKVKDKLAQATNGKPAKKTK